ncbi:MULTISPECIES: hypothetical protein [Leptolyngbya]|uniref:hypothetical protein n=1 Tax=Leptolyngbya TaxID=47251 RepID=UPI001683B54A|nr:hypothetical protein [Leptolyngbya sp. FACHB-1624]MBD1858328.1 hypothetical protein [Leptolyngbya sp. FACHB-1624]
MVQRWKNRLSARDFLLTESSTLQNKILEPSLDTTTEDENDYGLLDYYDIVTRESEAMLTPLRAIAEATIDIGTQIQRRSDEVDSLGTLGTQGDYTRFKQVVQLVAEDMSRYSIVLEKQLPSFSESRDNAFEALSRGIALGRESSSNDSEGVLEDQIRDLEEGISNVKGEIAAFRGILAALPKIDSRFNKSRRNVIASLDSVIREFDATLDMARNILNAFHTTR